MRFFRSGTELRRWLEKNHDREPELILGLYRKGSGKKSVTYQEALDEALCFGWIDGITHGVDDQRYMIRFTPRRPKSNWSRVNIKRVGELTALGRMAPAGLKTFEARDPARESGYSYEATLGGLDAPYEKLFRANRRGWAFFEVQPPGYRRVASWWVMSAKRQETRSRRLATLIDDSANGRRSPQVTGEARPRP
ncbi:MAG: YdeI family protein [Candidatus Limnocylindria bacterium]